MSAADDRLYPKPINTVSVRFDMEREEDRQAWWRLKSMDRQALKSYSRVIVKAINAYFDHMEATVADPYLETREKEDAFLEKVLSVVEQGAREAAPVLLAKELLAILAPALSVFPAGSMAISEMGADGIRASTIDQEEQKRIEEAGDDALDFADSF